jgi:flagellar hook-basal body complex protein FliE
MQTDAIQKAGGARQTVPIAAHNAAAESFGNLLQQAIDQVNQTQQEAEKAAQDFAIGESQSIHDTIIRLEKADLSLRLLTQVRNKVVEAYQEVMRMQV